MGNSQNRCETITTLESKISQFYEKMMTKIQGFCPEIDFSKINIRAGLLLVLALAGVSNTTLASGEHHPDTEQPTQTRVCNIKKEECGPLISNQVGRLNTYDETVPFTWDQELKKFVPISKEN